MIDPRGWLELCATCVLLSLLFGVWSIDLASAIAEDSEPGTGTLLTGASIGVGVGVGLTVLLLLSWRQDPGRLGQRLGRRAWREGRLPDSPPNRGLAIADLRRRERAATSVIAPLILCGFWAFIGVLQIVSSESPLHTVAWLLLVAGPGALTRRVVIDRNRLPQLRALLEQDKLPSTK